jgi:serine phosphatase RsbU (regulator of sigma subunit)
VLFRSGSDRLLEVLKEGQKETCETVQRKVFEAVRTFASTAAQSDDITLVLVRRR